MLYLLFSPLRDYWIIFNLFRYITFRAFSGGALAIILVLLLGRPLIKMIKKRQISQQIKEFLPPAHQKNKKNIPTMGGILIMLSSLVSIFLFADLSNRYVQLGIFLLLSLTVLGFVDDYIKIRKKTPKGLKIRTKLFWQAVVSLVVAFLLYYYCPDARLRGSTQILFFKNIVINLGPFYILFVALFITGVSNAVNFADGLDGLASGLIAITAFIYGILAYCGGHFKIADYLNILYIRGLGELSIFALVLVGGCLGFLWFNAHPSEIFMGDVGSLPLGGLLGFLACCAKQEILFIFAGGVFLIEALSVLIQVFYFRLTKGKRVFLMAPLHHHFELKGLNEEKIVVRFWLIGVLMGIIGLATLKIR